MAFFVSSAFYRRALAALGCATALTLQAVPSGRHTLPGHVPPAVAKLKPAGALAETNRLRLALGLPLRHQAELAALLRDLYDPAGAKFHQFLKPPEFAARFGPTEQDYATVSAFARSHGLQVVQSHANRLLLDVEGSVADVNKAFHVTMNVFQHPTENRTFYAPANEPSVEAGLPLQHIAGLDNYLLPKSNLAIHGSSNHAKALTGSAPDGAYMGHDFRAAYAPGVTLDGTGQTVALVEFDTFEQRDINNYEHTAGLSNVPVTTVPIDGFSGPPGSGQAEVSLDIEASISMAPGLSQVLVYEAPYGFTSVNDDLLNQIAIDDLANQIACCWLYTIDSTTDLIFVEMAAQGQSFFMASGDSGAYYTDPLPLLSDPNITLVGGTTLTTASVGGPWKSETVWSWFTEGVTPGLASSGGISTTYAIPFWQQAVNMSSNQGSTVARNMPDVAMVADNVFIIYAGMSTSAGGTSCATPLWAGFTALINQQAAQHGLPPVGFLDPAIYGAAQSALYPSIFHDITTGNNTNYNGSTEFFAVPGYDLCTGWGTPVGQALIDTLAPPDSLMVGPRGGLSFAAVTDYPLLIESQTLTLKNLGSTNIDWAFGPVPNWLSVSVSHGAISPGEAAFVTFAEADAATNLAPGNYETNLLVSNLTGVTHLVPVFLEVFDPLLITPDSGIAVIGPPGSPFDELTQTYSLTNFAAGPINWTAQSTSTFAGVSPASGTLESGASTNVIVTVDPSASNILISAQTGSLLFTDLTISNTQSLPFLLTVGNGGFETGDFSDWTLDGTGYPTNFVGAVLPWVNYIHSGEYAALLGQPYATASLSQTLPTVPGQLYQISFFLDNPVGGATNQFDVLWGGSTLFSEVNVPLIQWTQMVFTVFATNSTTTLQFVARNDPDYFGLDDISVTPAAAPTFSAATVSGTSILISWNAIPGANYQLQFSTDLTSWINSGFQVTATNSVMTVKKTLEHFDPQQYYRLYLVTK
jgi:Pro-kumamolisin, activation domain/Viral BACON domain